LIDLHSHILPGLDDGARDLDDALAIAHAAVRDGTTAIAATPHVRRDYPTTAEAMERGVDELQKLLERDRIDLRLLRGAELALEELASRPMEELRRFGLAGNPSYLLLETPYVGWPLSFPQTIEELVDAGITPVLGHPERNGLVQDDQQRVRELVEHGALIQLTAGSLDGRLGVASRSCARKLLQHELVHLVASDAHAAHVRQVGLSAAREAVRDRELADWLTESVPAAIVAGAPIPPRPPSGRGRRLRRLLTG
jgi:protein-tyrosine phosphatase